MPRWPEETITDRQAAEVAKNLIKGEMGKRNLTYSALADLLNRYGIDENERNLRNKISKGSFTAYFFFQCILAMGARDLDLEIYYDTSDKLIERVQKLLDEDDAKKTRPG